MMHRGQRQRHINEDESLHLAAARLEVFDTVGKPLTTSSTTGASLRQLMERMGHSTTRAALIYQHRSTERDRLIADAMSKLAETEIRQTRTPSGTQPARKRRKAP